MSCFAVYYYDMKHIGEARILIIEDADLAMSLICIFEDMGVNEVHRISSITESKMIDLYKYDMILMDLNLVDSKNPDEVFRHISSRCDLSKIVVSSGLDNLCLWSYDRGVKCLPKPFHYCDLIKAIKGFFILD